MQPEISVVGPKAKQKTLPRVRAFLANYSRTGNIGKSAKAAGISVRTHYKRLKVDPIYAEAFLLVQEELVQSLEDRAVELALAGNVTLLVILLRRFRPTKYREHIVQEHSGSIDLVERLQAANARLIAMRSPQESVSPAA